MLHVEVSRVVHLNMSCHAGLISANDLRDVAASFGEEWSDENVNDMIYYRKSNGPFFLFA